MINISKVLVSFCVIFLSSCTVKQVLGGAAQFEANKHCDSNSNVSYLRCGTNLKSEYEKNKALHERVLKEADETKNEK